MAILTIEEARSWARDYESRDEEIELFVAMAEEYIAGAVGKEFDRSSQRAKLLAGMFVAEIDDTRGASAAERTTRRYLTESLIAQLQAEYTGAPDLDTGEARA